MKKKTYNVAIAGATGVVGGEFLKILEERKFPVGRIRLLASERSAGSKLRFRGEEEPVRLLEEETFEGMDIGLFSPGAKVSEQYAPKAAAAGCVVVDCLTFWVSNLLLRGEWPGAILERAEAVRAFLAKRAFPVILVTNEVGMGVVPENALARAYRDACGQVHQVFSREADEVYFAAMGTMLRLKPGPVEAVASL